MAEAARKLPPLMTVEEFLAWPGDGTGTRYELVEGELRAMAPATPTHGTILANLIYRIAGHLEATRPSCRVVTAPGIQPLLRAGWNHRIPELGVSCARDERGAQMLADPILLIEVPLPSKAADTWSNIWLYATIPSVAEILIVHSAIIKAELLRRGANGVWPENPAPVAGREASISLASIDLETPMEAIYRGTYLLA